MAKFRRASADEAQSKRKEHLKSCSSGLAIVKGFKAPPSWNKETRSARFIMTSESVDRYMDIVVQAGGDFTNFMNNPQGLLFHNGRSWPCGLWSDVTKILNGRPKRTEGTLNFLPEGTDEDADRAARHVSVGSLRTVSIGFRPDWDEVDFILDDDDDWTGGFRFNKWELIECSLVPIPAQPDALVKDAGGDMVLARNLIEDVLDTWAKTPEGLLIPLDEYRAKHLDLVGEKSFHMIRGELPAPEPKTAKLEDLALKAETNEEASVHVGAKVRWNPKHPDNQKEDSAANLLFKDMEGEIIAGWIVQSGESKGVFALAVEWSKDGEAKGMTRGIRADQVLRVKADTAAAEDKGNEEPEPDGMDEEDKTSDPSADEAKSGPALLTDNVRDAFAALVKDGDVILVKIDDEMRIVLEREGKDVEELVLPVDMKVGDIGPLKKDIAERVEKKKAAAQKTSSTVSIDVDTTEAVEKLTAFERLMDSVAAKMSKIFGKSEPDPEPPAPPTSEEIEAAKAKSAEIRKRLVEKGLLEAA